MKSWPAAPVASYSRALRWTAALDERRVAFAIGVMCFLVYLGQLRYVGAADTVPAELLPISIIREQNVDFDEFVPRRGEVPGWFVVVNDRVVSAYPIVPGVLNVPGYLVAYLAGVDIFAQRQRLSLFTAALTSAISTVGMYLTLSGLGVGRGRALGLTLVYAFGTTVWSVASHGLWQHGPSLMFLTLGLWLLTAGTWRRDALAGLLLGFAIFNRPANAVIVAPLAIAVFHLRPRSFLGFAALAALPVALMLYYSWVYLGSVWQLGQGQAYTFGLSGNWVEGLFGILVSPSRGLLVFSPVFIFALVAVALAGWTRKLTAFQAATAVGILLTVGLYARWIVWWGGHSFGYRLLTEAVPLLTIWLAIAWDRYVAGSRALRLVFFVSAGISLVIHFLGAIYYPCGFNTSPDNVDVNTTRLWEVANGELARCAGRFLDSVALR